jgi:hypothetical protein
MDQLSSLQHPHTFSVTQILSSDPDSNPSLGLEKKWSEAIDVRFARLEGFLQFYKDYFDSMLR